MEGLTVGNTAQYAAEDGVVYAAIVTKVWDTVTGRVNLTIFRDDGSIAHETSRTYSEDGTPGTWHWLPGVDAPSAPPDVDP